MLSGISRSGSTRTFVAVAATLLCSACDDDIADAIASGSLDASVDAYVALAPSLPSRAEMDASLLPLVDNRSWRRVDDAGIDPLASHQPAMIDCWPSATYPEHGSYEVDTTHCNYLYAETPSLRAVDVGAKLQLDLIYFDLLAPEPAQAHVALLFGDELQWEHAIPIPSLASRDRPTFTATRALAAGDPIRLHLHNHGANTYLLMSVNLVGR